MQVVASKHYTFKRIKLRQAFLPYAREATVLSILDLIDLSESLIQIGLLGLPDRNGQNIV